MIGYILAGIAGTIIGGSIGTFIVALVFAGKEEIDK